MTREKFFDILTGNGFLATTNDEVIIFRLETQNSRITFGMTKDNNHDLVTANMYSKGFYVSYTFKLSKLIQKYDFVIEKDEKQNEIKITIGTLDSFYIPC